MRNGEKRIYEVYSREIAAADSRIVRLRELEAVRRHVSSTVLDPDLYLGLIQYLRDECGNLAR